MKLKENNLAKFFAFVILLNCPQFSFSQCPDCCNGVQDCTETGIDCGGPDCMPCGSLVPNGSFECVTFCFVTGSGQIQAASPWTYVDATEPSDLFNSCFTFDANIQTPNNFRGTQAPHTGSGYAGFLAQNDASSDPRAGYVQIQLSTPLIAGTNYDLSFWVSLADNYGMAMGGLGAYFSVGLVAPGDNAPLNAHGINPQIASDIFTHITDATNWTNITGTYTAVGGENHIVLGNFKTTFSPPSPLVTYTCCGSSLSYYYIDDVSLVPSPVFPVDFSSFTAKVDDEKVKLQWTTETEQNSDRFIIERRGEVDQFVAVGDTESAVNSSKPIDYQWYDNQPLNGNNYYRIKQVDLDGKFVYTEMVTVDYKSPLLINWISVSADRSSLNYEISIGKSNQNEMIRIELFDQMGRFYKQEEFEGSESRFNGTLPIGRLNPGIYFARFSSSRQAVTKKFIVMQK